MQLAPAIALVTAILVDEGPTGEARASSHFFPLVLWIFDDFAWTCARNSLTFAVLVSLGSLVLGLGLRCALDRVWLPARSPAGAAALAAVVLSPAFLALGLTGLSSQPERWSLPFASTAAAPSEASLESWSAISLWATWVWSGLIPGAGLVAIACGPSFRRLNPSWTDAARLAGATSFRIARDLSWPIVRPAAARAAGLVFLLAIVEPGAPLVLGLRRTLAFQIVEAATGANPFPRAAVWTIMAGLLGLCGWLVFRWSGGNSIPAAPSRAATTKEQSRRVRRGSPLASVVSSGGLAFWTIVAWLPVFGLIRLATRGVRASLSGSSTPANDYLSAIAQLRDRLPRQVLVDSALFALAVASGLLLVAGVARPGSRERARPAWQRWFRLITALPPLVLGVCVLAVCSQASLASRFLLDHGQVRAAVSVGDLAATIDTRQHPWIMMGFAVALVLLPLVFQNRSRPLAAAAEVPRFDPCREAALQAGASRPRAWALANPGAFSRWIEAFVLVWAAAATNVTPAVLFSPDGDGKTLGPAIIELAIGDPAARSQAAVLALTAGCTNLAAIALAFAIRALPPDRDRSLR